MNMEDPLRGTFFLTLVINVIMVLIILLKLFVLPGNAAFARWVLLPASGALAFSVATLMMDDGIVAHIVSLVLMLTYAVSYMVLTKRRSI